ncbi:nitrile hydratase accessory protein [Aurantimonas sp. A2-1-M11]|uniref:nitrile hydratase accessory protein n=1 Tax=Aurantimonas sp. A2-1-M11 TaxID=3113712 RepID=UPI002F92EA3A
MFQPDDPLAPPGRVFDEPWQAQALALADALVQQGRFSALDWAEALGAELSKAEAQGGPDTMETYYLAVLVSLERLCETRAGISGTDRARRRSEWEAAYRRTPHGEPVELRADGLDPRAVSRGAMGNSYQQSAETRGSPRSAAGSEKASVPAVVTRRHRQ